MNIADLVVGSAGSRPDKAAIKLDDATLTYAQLDAATKLVAGLLADHGIGAGDRVGLMLPNVPQWAVLYYGILRTGAVAVPMNPLLKEREVAHYLGDSGAKLAFVWQEALDEGQAGAKQVGVDTIPVDPSTLEEGLLGYQPVDGVVDRDPSDTAVLLYTSGTTGQPKGAELTHANLGRNIEIIVELLRLRADDVVFGGLPLFHAFGQSCGLNASVAAGATLTLLARFEPTAALGVLARDRVTVFQGVPVMFRALVDHPHRDSFDVSALRVCASGGAALPIEVMNDFENAFGCVVLEGYGLSETSPLASFNPAAARKPGSIGTPVAGVDMRIVDDQGDEVPVGELGEIVIRGHNVMKGYWANPTATAAAIRDGWLYSGDIGRVDEDGFFFIVDRKKDMIIRGGHNVYPREIEKVIYEHAAVAEAAVIGIPHAELGEEVAAVVSLKPGCTVSPEELRDHVKSQVAAYKYPRVIQLTAALPKTATGKLLKRQIVVDSTESSHV
jgi:long-chain acyl-CoA synthetase